jgi:hypothetical protein
MELKTAQRKRVKIKMNISSPSGFGKTYSSLLLAYGITGNWETIAIIDTENDSASLYSHLGNFKTINLEAPYSPERYIEAITICEKAGIQVIIIDSITHVWKGVGGILEFQNSLGGKYQDWAKATPLYQKWLNKILYSDCHIITTTRKKQGYNMITEGNKTKVEKAGLEDEIREGLQYELTIAFEIINDKHFSISSKYRTSLFVNQAEFIITPQTGKMILDWCNAGEVNTVNEVVANIEACKSVDELFIIYKAYPQFQQTLKEQYQNKKRQLILSQDELQLSIKPSSNGIH